MFAFLSLLACAPLAYSKGPVDLILVSGGGLTEPIQITDAVALKAFDPWMGQFADWSQRPLVDAENIGTIIQHQRNLRIAGTGIIPTPEHIRSLAKALR
jgi:hypothetical protein